MRRPGRSASTCCRIREVKRGDIIVFRYPSTIQEDYVKRVIGVPGDHIKLVNKSCLSERQAAERALRDSSFTDSPSITATIFPAAVPTMPDSMDRSARRDAARQCVNGELVVPPGHLLRHGRQSRQLARQPLLGLCAARNIIGKPLIIFWSYDAPTERSATAISTSTTSSISRSTSSPRRAGTGRSSWFTAIRCSKRRTLMCQSESLRPDSGRRPRYALLAAQPPRHAKQVLQLHRRANADPADRRSAEAGASARAHLDSHQRSSARRDRAPVAGGSARSRFWPNRRSAIPRPASAWRRTSCTRSIRTR